jgi:hypothetical protein
MLAAMRALLGIVSLAWLATVAHADPFAQLKTELPAGWKVEQMSSIVGIVRTAPVMATGRHAQWQPSNANIPKHADVSSVELKLGVWFRTERAWDAARYRAAEIANGKIHAQIRQARIKHGIDKIKTSKGVPLPKTADERMRLSAYDIEAEELRSKLVVKPRCELGGLSLFEHEPVQLDLIVEPTIAMRELYAVVELLKRVCR